MNSVIASYFFSLMLVYIGFYVATLPKLCINHSIKGRQYWKGAVLAGIFAYGFFGLGLMVDWVDEGHHWILTAASLLYLSCQAMTFMFYRSLRADLKPALRWQLFFGIVIVGAIYEYMRRVSGGFERLILVECVAMFICIEKFLELNKNPERRFSQVLKGLRLIGFCEIAVPLSVILTLCFLRPIDNPTIEHLSAILLGFLFMQSAVSLLAFAGINGLWAEASAREKRSLHVENDQIRSLLNDKKILLDSMADFSRAAEAGGLTAALTHEISQPLGAAMFGLAHLKARLNSMEGSPEIATLVDKVIFENARANQSVHLLRQLFRPTFGLRNSVKSLIDPKIVVDQILSVVACRSKQAKVNISVKNSNDHNILVRADDFYTIALNFVLNALDALEESHKINRAITIFLLSQPTHLSLIVDDNGLGISTEFADQIFQLRKTTKAEGMGVGLWLCHQLCSLRGYSISFNSAPGEGAKFEVLFPAASSEPHSSSVLSSKTELQQS